jgi:hypothetical protein
MNVKLYIIVFFLLSITSCFNEKQKENQIVEEPISFPTLKCDKGLATFIKYYESIDPISYMEFELEYFYIGKIKDTIQLDLVSFYIMPPPPVPDWFYKKHKNDDDSIYQNKNQNMDYYIKWDEDKNFERGEKVNIKIQVDTSKNIFNKMPLYLTNKYRDTIILSTHHGILATIEALDSNNKWIPLNSHMVAYCGVGLGHIFLPPNECAITLVPIFKGSYKTKFRLRYGKNFSNPYDGFMNYKLFAEIDYNSD